MPIFSNYNGPTHSHHPPPIEVYWAYLVHARRGALEALAQAKARHNPSTAEAELATLQAVVDELESQMKQLAPLRPPFSIGLVTGMTTWGSSRWTL